MDLKFAPTSKLSPLDNSRLNRAISALPQKVAGQTTFSSSPLAVPGASTVQPSGQIAPTGITATGSTFAFVVQGNLAFTSTGGAITIYWDGTNGSKLLAIRRADGSNLSIPAGSMTISDLTAGTQYGFAPFICVAQPNSLSFAVGDAGQSQFAFSPAASPAQLASASRTQRLTTNEPLTVGLIYFTANVGAGGTGTGSYTGN